MTTSHPAQNKIDEWMEQASRALVAREYFACERFCLQALRRAHAAHDFARMSRIILPLQEARRLKRQLALDANHVVVISEQLPNADELVAGCYLITPPRVGVDGRLLREAANQREVPVLVLVREPPSRDGLWPMVAVGPVTVRAKVAPPKATTPAKKSSASARTKKTLSAKSKGSDDTHAMKSSPSSVSQRLALPTSAWFMQASEAIGDTAISQIVLRQPAATRVDHLLERLEAMPDHEKLHQRLRETCEIAMHEPLPKKRALLEVLEENEDL